MGKVIALIVIIILIVGAGIFLYKGSKNTSNIPTPTPTQSVIFPKSADTLVEQNKYTLRWNGGPATTQIFLIDTSLESEGASVSIVDRVYDVKNTGQYDFIVPNTLRPGNYKFEIGNLTSEIFKITNGVAQKYCLPGDLQASITTEGAAGNIYGTLSLRNISTRACQIIGSNFVEAVYDAKNITVGKMGTAGEALISIIPDKSIYSEVHYPNGPQCQSGTGQASVKFGYQISPDNKILFKNQNGNTVQSVTVCKSLSEKTKIDLWSTMATPSGQ